jgi:hypothetical protein
MPSPLRPFLPAVPLLLPAACNGSGGVSDGEQPTAKYCAPAALGKKIFTDGC